MAAKTIYLRSVDDRLIRKIREISGQNVYRCMQCGTCSAVCPMCEYMELTPRNAMLLLQHGQSEELDNANIGFHCAACHTCMVRCPRDLDIPRIMEAIRQLTLRENVDFIDVGAISKETLEDAPQIVFVSAFRKLTA